MTTSCHLACQDGNAARIVQSSIWGGDIVVRRRLPFVHWRIMLIHRRTQPRPMKSQSVYSSLADVRRAVPRAATSIERGELLALLLEEISIVRHALDAEERDNADKLVECAQIAFFENYRGDERHDKPEKPMLVVWPTSLLDCRRIRLERES